MRRNLKILRIQNGFNQDEMAMRLGVSRTTYCRIERGNSEGTMTFWLGLKRMFPEINIEEIAKTEGEKE